jgi:hypothetical protein
MSEKNTEDPKQKTGNLPRKMQIICKFWMMGTCNKDDKCEYLHNNADFKKGKNNLISPECPFYSFGFCKSGPLCKFKHTELPQEENPFEEIIENDSLNNLNENIESLPLFYLEYILEKPIGLIFEEFEKENKDLTQKMKNDLKIEASYNIFDYKQILNQRISFNNYYTNNSNSYDFNNNNNINFLSKNEINNLLDKDKEKDKDNNKEKEEKDTNNILDNINENNNKNCDNNLNGIDINKNLDSNQEKETFSAKYNFNDFKFNNTNIFPNYNYPNFNDYKNYINSTHFKEDTFEFKFEEKEILFQQQQQQLKNNKMQMQIQMQMQNPYINNINFLPQLNNSINLNNLNHSNKFNRNAGIGLIPGIQQGPGQINGAVTGQLPLPFNLQNFNQNQMGGNLIPNINLNNANTNPNTNPNPNLSLNLNLNPNSNMNQNQNQISVNNLNQKANNLQKPSLNASINLFENLVNPLFFNNTIINNNNNQNFSSGKSCYTRIEIMNNLLSKNYQNDIYAYKKIQILNNLNQNIKYYFLRYKDFDLIRFSMETDLIITTQENSNNFLDGISKTNDVILIYFDDVGKDFYGFSKVKFQVEEIEVKNYLQNSYEEVMDLFKKQISPSSLSSNSSSQYNSNSNYNYNSSASFIKIEWLWKTKLSYDKVEILRNPFENFELFINSKDGQEIYPDLGFYVCRLMIKRLTKEEVQDYLYTKKLIEMEKNKSSNNYPNDPLDSNNNCNENDNDNDNTDNNSNTNINNNFETNSLFSNLENKQINLNPYDPYDNHRKSSNCKNNKLLSGEDVNINKDFFVFKNFKNENNYNDLNNNNMIIDNNNVNNMENLQKKEEKIKTINLNGSNLLNLRNLTNQQNIINDDFKSDLNEILLKNLNNQRNSSNNNIIVTNISNLQVNISQNSYNNKNNKSDDNNYRNEDAEKNKERKKKDSKKYKKYKRSNSSKSISHSLSKEKEKDKDRDRERDKDRERDRNFYMKDNFKRKISNGKTFDILDDDEINIDKILQQDEKYEKNMSSSYE